MLLSVSTSSLEISKSTWALLADPLVLQQFAVRDRRVRLHQEPLRLGVVDEIVRRVGDVHQDLVDHRLDGAGSEEVLDVLALEVRYADGAQLACLVCHGWGLWMIIRSRWSSPMVLSDP